MYFLSSVFSIIVLFITIDIQAKENDLVVYDYINRIEYQYSSGINNESENEMISADSTNRTMTKNVAEGYIPSTLFQEGNILPNELISTSQMNVVNPNVYPNTAITHLKIGFDTTGNGKADTWYIGSGYIVGPDVMVTAAHCFWSDEYGWAVEVRTYLKYEQDKISNYYYPASWICSTEYTENGNTEYDWCVVTLQQNVGAITGWLGFGVSADSSLIGKDIKVAGFTYSDSGRIYQFQSLGKIRTQNERTISYDASTQGGQSGGPVFDDDGIAWGIHAYGGQLNSGCVINSYLFNLLDQKREEGIEKYN